ALYERPRYYDHAFKHHTRDAAFYAELAREIKGPVLELGAGTGRISFALVRAGARVVAVDRSEAMLARARERALKLTAAEQKRLTFHAADLRELALRERFGLVLAPFNLFMHLYTRDDVERALRTVRRHLRPNGVFALDVLMPDLGVLRRDPARVYRCRPVFDPTDRKHYAYGESFDYDPIRQVQTVKMMFQQLDRPERDRETPLALRFFFPEELLALLHYNGFTVKQRFGAFDRSAPDPESEHQIIIAHANKRR
ncbi:MAG TPA: class I SAM-dependent methyltransferase, partial [Polyangiales bacterium]|nr:class I SAM-dependent methyltransferase [Polyangiales bacterium]